MIDYTEFRKRIEEKGIVPYTLKSVKVNGKGFMSQSNLSKIMSPNEEHLNTATIEELCQLFQCQPMDLLKDHWTVELDPTKSFEAIAEASKKEKEAKKHQPNTQE